MSLSKSLFLSLIPVYFSIGAPAQETMKKDSLFNQLAGLGLSIPVGEFARTQSFGFAASYSWSRSRFGRLRSLPGNAIGFIAHADVEYYLGKKVTVAGYDVKYRSYFTARLSAGIMHNAGLNAGIFLSAGPVMEVYHDFTDFGGAAHLGAHYFFKPRMGISPAVQVLKFKEAAALWALSLKASLLF